MKEIGEKLRETRTEMDISIEEAALDLKLEPSQISSIEEGNIKDFKDIFSLKYFIRDYSKYLGLDYEDMIDEFNEYLFDYTSKITVDDIKEAKKKIKDEEDKKIKSPYTIERKNMKKIYLISVLIIIVIAVLVGALYIIVKSNKDIDEPITTSYVIGGNYELA